MNNHPTRRDFLKCTAVLPLAATAGLLSGTASAAVAPIKRAGGAHLKTSLNAYSFLDLLNAAAKDPSQGLNLFQLCDFCAKHDFDAVDLTGYFFPGYPKAITQDTALWDRYFDRTFNSYFRIALISSTECQTSCPGI